MFFDETEVLRNQFAIHYSHIFTVVVVLKKMILRRTDSCDHEARCKNCDANMCASILVFANCHEAPAQPGALTFRYLR